MPQCYFCHKEVPEEDYCYGCKEYVCNDCDETGAGGNHAVEEHKAPDDEVTE